MTRDFPAPRAERLGVYYWRKGPKEVDFVVKKGKSVTAMEVKSGQAPRPTSRMQEFSKKFKAMRLLLVGSEGIPLDKSLSNPISKWIG
jgi:predicted AAA+ superfamily ATPase